LEKIFGVFEGKKDILVILIEIMANKKIDIGLKLNL
jgi:hypothetical protein